MELPQDILTRPLLFFFIGSHLSLKDLFRVRCLSLLIRATLYSQTKCFWGPIIKATLDYREYLGSGLHFVDEYGLDGAKHMEFKRPMVRAVGQYLPADVSAFARGLYPSYAGFAYAAHQFPQLVELDAETMRESSAPELTSAGFPREAEKVEVEEVREEVPWHLLAWDLLFMDTLVGLYPLSREWGSFFDAELVAHPIMFRREAGTPVTVDEAARQVGLGVICRHRLIVFPFEELVRGYEVIKARAADWTPESPIRHPMEVQPFNFALPAFERIGDPTNTIAFCAYYELYRLPRNALYMLRMSSWTGNWVGVFSPDWCYPPAYKLRPLQTVEEVLSSSPVHEYHVAEEWLGYKDVPAKSRSYYYWHPYE
eukprot:GILK01014453.1.p1 GENE.GILK01014453.1~~GILK01014453.1.p1  ORF type:complete len:369 (-),score=40.77 GILK01014453.1:334-1440(-)